MHALKMGSAKHSFHWKQILLKKVFERKIKFFGLIGRSLEATNKRTSDNAIVTTLIFFCNTAVVDQLECICGEIKKRTNFGSE